MSYSNYVGKEYRFKKGDKVPKWIYESDVAFWGTDVLVIADELKVHIKGFVPSAQSYYWKYYFYPDKSLTSESLIEVRNPNGEMCIQVCPQISFCTDCRDVLSR